MRTTNGNGLEALTRARPDALDPAKLAGSARQHEDLATLLATEPSPTSTRPRTRGTPGRRRVLVPAIGAAAVAALAIGTVVITNHPPAAPDSVAAAAAKQGSLVLLNMANSVQNDATQGPYWEQQTRSGTLNLVANGADPYVIASAQQENWSIGVLPGEQSVLVTGIGATTGPRSQQDRQRWQHAGSPSNVDVDANQELRGKDLLEYPIGNGHEESMRTDYNGDIVALGPDNVNYADLRQLPSDQTELTVYLDKLFRGTREDQSQAAGWMFQQVSNLITFPVPSAVRASAYRILASLPGITSLGQVTDPLGRTGIGLALAPMVTGDLGAEQQQLIVDPTTSTILCQQTVLVRPTALDVAAGLTEGTVVNYTATTHIGWTDQQVAPPTSH